MLYQFHHQNKENRKETVMIAQISIIGGENKKMREELKETHTEDPPPEGWEWLIVPEGAKEFVYTTEEEIERLINEEAKNNVNVS